MSEDLQDSGATRESPELLEPLYQAELSTADVHALIRDVEQLCQLQWVRSRPDPSGEPAPAPTTLAGVRDALREGTLRSVQLCYRYEQDVWVDTLTIGSRFVELVRLRPPVDPD